KIRNEGEKTLPDIRIVDGVPDSVEVVRGSPKIATALRPGEEQEVNYEISVPIGEHDFCPAYCLTLDALGVYECLSRPSDDTTITSQPVGEEVEFPLPQTSMALAGRQETSQGGAGLEFYSTRNYRRGDPLARIDWKKFARNRELSTLQFREERAASIVILIDARLPNFVTLADEDRSTIDQSREAAYRLFKGFTSDGHRAGIGTVASSPAWLSPGGGTIQDARARHLLTSHPSFKSREATDADGFYGATAFANLHSRLPDNAQIIFLSPFVDDYASSLVRRLFARGYPISILSPDPTKISSAGARLERIQRVKRLSKLRGLGINVIDWGEGPLEVALSAGSR
ncbi:MAG: DUF58 domain-containing protein, partial [Halobacteriaceae archaeon]